MRGGFRAVRLYGLERIAFRLRAAGNDRSGEWL